MDDNKQDKPIFIQTDFSGQEIRIAAEAQAEVGALMEGMGASVPSDPPCPECKDYADMTFEEKQAMIREKLKNMSPEERAALAASMVQPKRGPKDYGKKGHRRPRGPAPVKQPPMPKPNEKCPCGSGKKFKKCCGSNAGDLHYFVAYGETALEDDAGRLMVFKDTTTAIAAAKAKRWADGDIIPLPPARFEKLKENIPYVMVVAKEFDVAPEEGEKEVVQPITDMARIMTTVIKENRDAAMKEAQNEQASDGANASTDG